MAQIDEIRKIRLETVAAIHKAGWDPYASKFDKQHTIGFARDVMGTVVKTAGKVMSMRTHGDISFADLRDPTGSIQIFFKKDVLGDEAYKNLKLIDVGDFIGVEGEVVTTAAGEISILPTTYTFLTKSILPMPDDWYGLKDVETRYRKRYLDLLMNDDVRTTFATRSKIISLLRHFLEGHGFTEFETPVLQPLYGGTTAKPFVTHHNTLDEDFYLRIAVELYLKRIMVGGYEKVYELGKNFRNEGFSRAHNPEFTMLEFYWAYADYQDLMTFTEEMLCHVIQNVKGSLQVEFEDHVYDFTAPWPRKTFKELFMEHLQIDIDEVNTEEKLAAIVKERKLLDHKVIGYGFMLDEVFKKNIRPSLKGPMFLIDHPVELKPLAKRAEYDPTKSAGFQLVVDGVEFINAYNELNDPVDQYNRWIEDMKVGEKGGEEYQVLDEDYIEALSYGMPPTAGWGMGIDRLTAFLTNQHTIKDVILFPMMRPERQKAPEIMTLEKGKVRSKAETSSEDTEQLVMTREMALAILEKNMTTKNLVSHCLAVEAAMRALATKLGGNPDIWGLTGLLHDADWDITRDSPQDHTHKTIEWIKEAGETSPTVIEGILSHNHHHNGFRQPESVMEWALYTCDELTGFIVAVTLVRPDKKIANVEAKSVIKKFANVAFARPVDREQIKMCQEKLGIPIEEFVAIVLKAMQDISDTIGL